jgi:hypothetical protein
VSRTAPLFFFDLLLLFWREADGCPCTAATGLKADARQVLLAHLRRKHKAVASSVVGELTADKHTTRNQLLAAARELYHDLHPL